MLGFWVRICWRGEEVLSRFLIVRVSFSYRLIFFSLTEVKLQLFATVSGTTPVFSSSHGHHITSPSSSWTVNCSYITTSPRISALHLLVELYSTLSHRKRSTSLSRSEVAILVYVRHSIQTLACVRSLQCFSSLVRWWWWCCSSHRWRMVHLGPFFLLHFFECFLLLTFFICCFFTPLRLTGEQVRSRRLLSSWTLHFDLKKTDYTT